MGRLYRFLFLLATNRIVFWQTVYAQFLLKIMDGLMSLPSMTARRTQRERYWKHSRKAMTACVSLKAENRRPDGLASPTPCSKHSITPAASGYWQRMPT